MGEGGGRAVGAEGEETRDGGSERGRERGSGMKMWALHYSWSQRRSVNGGWDLMHSLHMHIGNLHAYDKFLLTSQIP